MAGSMSGNSSQALTEKIQAHRALYKGRTPPWKDNYRQRCLNRLKAARNNILNRYRDIHILKNMEEEEISVVKEVMNEEWKNMPVDNYFCPPLIDLEVRKPGESIYTKLFSEDKEFNAVVGMLEDIKEELIQEEQQIIAEYQAGLDLEAESTCVAVKQYCDEQVICPMCLKDFVQENENCIFCMCGFQLEKKRQDGLIVSVPYLEKLLQEGIYCHGRRCEATPQFSLAMESGTTNLLITCPFCDLMFIIV